MKHKLLLLLALTLGLASNVWADDPTGEGTEASPYQIYDANDLLWFANKVNAVTDGNPGAWAKLMDDIYMNDLGETPWTPIGNADHKYTGTFDGQGYSIEGFSYTTTSTGAHGLFGYVNNATIKNFSISGTLESTGTTDDNTYIGVIGAAEANSRISGIRSALSINVPNCKTHTGGVLGSTVTAGNPVLVENCEYSGIMTHTGDKGDCQAGILGYTYNGGVKNCIFRGTINGKDSKYGGILGYCKVPSFLGVQNCLSIGKIVANSGNTTAAAIIANYNGAATSNVKNNYYCLKEGSTTTIAIGNKASNCEAPVLVTAERLASGEVCYNLNDSTNGGTNWYQTLTGEGSNATPVLSNTSQRVYKKSESTYASFDVEDEKIQIGSATDLTDFAGVVNTGETALDAEMTTDINLNEEDASDISWNPIGDWNTGKVTSAYKGHFDGRGYSITGLTTTSTQDNYGLFGVLSTNAIVENFTICGTITNVSYNNIGVIGFARDNSVTIRNIHSCVKIETPTSKRVGGILGQAYNGTVNIDRCTYSGDLNLTGTGNYGGIVGFVNTSSSAITNITNCLFDGKIINSNDGKAECGGIVGYIGDGPKTTIQNCLAYGTITASVQGQICGAIKSNNVSIANCYYKGTNIYGTKSNSPHIDATQITDDTKFTSGEICYLLNSDQSDIAFYQTIEPEPDDYPTLNATRGRVYINGECNCDGTLKDGEVEYTNAGASFSIDSHDYEGEGIGGVCMACGMLKPSYCSYDNGYYEIDNEFKLQWFAAYVNEGHPKVNAKLTNITPIDMTGVTWTPIGNSSKKYNGTFDGQGHVISNLSSTGYQYNGLFGYINGAKVRNFTISGTIETKSDAAGNRIGVIGQADGSAEVSDIHSSLNITVLNDAHAGGIVGGGGNGTDHKVKIEKCSYSGTLTVPNNTACDCTGGIIGYTSAGTILNCLFTGTVTGGTDTTSGKSYGGILGYVNNANFGGVQNCLCTGSVSSSGSKAKVAAIIGNVNSTNTNETAVAKIKNNYYSTGSTGYAGTASPTPATLVNNTQLANGEVCYGLNGDQSGIIWYQTLGTDANPTLDSSKPQVYEIAVSDAGYTSFVPTVNVAAIPEGVTVYAGQDNGTYLHLEEVEEVPADNAFVVKATAGNYYYNNTDESRSIGSVANDLIYSPTALTSDGTQYCLANKASGVGFYQVNEGVTIPARKVYLASGSNVKAFFFDEDDATGINSPLLTSPEEEGQVYNLAGQRISKLQRGINIINGKKVLK